MRKGVWWIAVLLLGGAFWFGCQTFLIPQDTVPDSPTNLHAEANEGCLEPISADSLSQNVYDALQCEWDEWNLMSRESKMFSSHLPGGCRYKFDDWAACEEFLGISIPNPLETCTWLEKATYMAMPIGFRDTPRVVADWSGTEEGHVEWISVRAGYRSGEISVILDAALYGDSADTKPSDRGCAVELERQYYLANRGDSQLLMSAESTEKYYSNVVYQACGNVLYRFHVMGKPTEQIEVENTVDQVIQAFSNYQQCSLS